MNTNFSHDKCMDNIKLELEALYMSRNIYEVGKGILIICTSHFFNIYIYNIKTYILGCDLVHHFYEGKN